MNASFIHVKVADGKTETININDISRVKSWDVYAKKGDESTAVDGCLIERISHMHAVWCVEPKDDIVARLEFLTQAAGPKS